jgi:hypothetical protein
LAGAAVSVTCAGGSQTAAVTTNSSGSYTVFVEDGQAPCVVTATKTVAGQTVKYEAVTAGSGSALTVNVSPISTIIVELLKKDFGTGASAASLVGSAAARSALSGSVSSFVQAIQTAITNAAQGGNAVALAIGNNLSPTELQTILSGSFTPATSTAAGDATDGKLDLAVTALTNLNLINAQGVIDTTALNQAIATIDVPLAGTSGATGAGN